MVWKPPGWEDSPGGRFLTPKAGSARRVAAPARDRINRHNSHHRGLVRKACACTMSWLTSTSAGCGRAGWQVYSSRPLGEARAFNRMAKFSQNAELVVLTSDVHARLFTHEFLSRVQDAFAARPALALLVRRPPAPFPLPTAAGTLAGRCLLPGPVRGARSAPEGSAPVSYSAFCCESLVWGGKRPWRVLVGCPLWRTSQLRLASGRANR